VVAVHAIEHTGAPRRDEDVRLIIHGVSWGRYVAIRELLEDHPGLRMYYLEGTLEIMSPSETHELSKTTIARLIELYALEKGIHLNGYGSMTFRKEAKERGAEPDECYVLGGRLQERPDIVLEVVVTSGGIDKLAIYRGLGVPEVWFFESGRFQLHRLGPEGYSPVGTSAFLPELDIAEIARYVGYADQTEALLAFRATLRHE
jgi:Uma2 family endonuclease